MALREAERVRVAELVARAKAVASGAVALPAVYGVMHESSGRCAMQSKRWEEAKVEFLDAFKSYEEAGVSAKAATNLSLSLLAAMLSTSRINPFDDESVRSYKKVLIPEENAKDLADIPDNVKNALEIVPVSRMEEVLLHALVRQPKAIVWEEDTKAPAPPISGDDDVSGVVAH